MLKFTQFIFEDAVDAILEAENKKRGILTFNGRKKRKIGARRRKNQLKIARKRAAKRVASSDKIVQRAGREARRNLATHLAKGRDIKTLNHIAKNRLAGLINARSGQLQAIKRRAIPKARSRDRNKS